MEYKYLFDKAKKLKINELEIYIKYRKNVSIKTNNEKLENYISSEVKIYDLKGIVNGKMGKCKTEILNEDNCVDILNILINNADLMNDSEENPVNKKAYILKRDSLPNDGIDYNLTITNAFDLYKQLKKYNNKLYNMKMKYSFDDEVIEILNSYGLEVSDRTNTCNFVVSVVAEDKGIKSSQYDYELFLNGDKIDELSLCKDLIDRSVDMLDYKILNSATYPVIIKNKVVAQLLGQMANSFFATDIQQKKSFLVDKLGCPIASKMVNIIEEPNNETLYGFRLFDDEGVKTYTKDIVKNGIFETALHNLKTAIKSNVESTANGYNNGNGIRNMYIKPGSISFEEMLIKFNGVFITSLEGLHSGVNTNNGDFSLQAQGYEIIDGKVINSTKLIVLSGNFFEMLNNVEDIGNDLAFISEEVGAPTLKISSLDISGK